MGPSKRRGEKDREGDHEPHVARAEQGQARQREPVDLRTLGEQRPNLRLRLRLAHASGQGGHGGEQHPREHCRHRVQRALEAKPCEQHAARNPQEAIDLFTSIADDPELRLNMWLEVGDLQFVHNHTILHDRTAYEDWPEPERKRHLLRLWIAAEGARPLSDAWLPRYGSVEVGRRGGIVNRDTVLKTPMVAD